MNAQRSHYKPKKVLFLLGIEKFKKIVRKMAKPIEPTPILTGKDAEAFRKAMDEFQPDPQKAAFLKECVDLARKLRF